MSLEATLATWELSKKIISSSEKLLLLCLARRAGEDHTCWPSVKRMAEDTSMDRKSIVSIRQNLIDKGLIKYTGEKKGKSCQVPVMKLLYVDEWERDRNSPRLKDDEYDEKIRKKLSTNDTELGTGKKVTSTENGIGTSTENGTGTSTENGTVNIKEEKVRGSFKKSKSKSFYENEKKHPFAKSMNQMASERKHIKAHQKMKEVDKALSKKIMSEMYEVIDFMRLDVSA